MNLNRMPKEFLLGNKIKDFSDLSFEVGISEQDLLYPPNAFWKLSPEHKARAINLDLVNELFYEFPSRPSSLKEL